MASPAAVLSVLADLAPDAKQTTVDDRFRDGCPKCEALRMLREV